MLLRFAAPMPVSDATSAKPSLAILAAIRFIRAHPLRVLLLSLLVLIPCFWHRRIEAGDLGSHLYNAWLAQLIAKGQAPGLYVVRQWNNVLADLSLLHLGNLFGLHAAEKIVVAAAVLIFFWGVFSFVAAVTERAPWIFTPCIAVLAYGYAFSMGFLNYYLSLGLACFALAILWRGGAGNWLTALPVAALALLAHPIGFLWLVATLAYVALWRLIPEWWRLLLAAFAVAAVYFVSSFIRRDPSFDASWPEVRSYLMNGSDQLNLFGHRYAVLASAAAIWGILCFLLGFVLNYLNLEGAGKKLRLPLEVYFVAFLTTSLLPENIHVDLYAGWVGLIVSRLTAISAILGLCVLACFPPRRLYAAGFLACAAVFFAFLYRDTGTLNRIEANAEQLVATLSYGTRIIPVVNAPGDWRVDFIHHSIERACIGHCFSYSNYEPSSEQFRIRAHPGNPFVCADSDDAESMPSGDYLVKPTDPPMIAIFQCDDSDPTKLCSAPLHPGDKTETPALNYDGDQ